MVVAAGLRRAARVRWRLTPWWGRVLLVYGASRIVTTTILLAFAQVQGAASGTPAPDYFTFATNWDGRWYQLIAFQGYPAELPTDAEGHVAQNAWAFMPLYPFLLWPLVRIGFAFEVVAPLASLVFGAVACLLFYLLMRESLPAGSSLFAVALLCVAPVSPMFQVAYAESLQLALLFGALLLVQRRRYAAALPVIVVAAFTRPTGLAFALFLLLHFIVRIVAAVRSHDREPLPLRESATIVGLGLTTFAAGLAWPAIAWAVTGSATAYTDTELAWRAGYVGRGELVPFLPWFQGADFWLRFLGVPPGISALVGAFALVVVLAITAAFLLSPWAQRLGTTVRLWVVSYLVYLLAVFFPQSSTWRLLLPASPLLGALAVPRSRVFRIVLLMLGVAGQIVWVHWCWWHDAYDWSPP